MKLHSLRIFFCTFGALQGFQWPLLIAQESGGPARLQSAAKLNIAVIAGSNAANLVKETAATQSIVEVRDVYNHPVPGAVVNFTSPEIGPSVLFPNGERTFSVVAEANGRATVQEMEPVGTGPFELRVTAESDGQFVSVQIPQTNYLSRADAMKARAEIANLSMAEPAERRGISHRAVVGIMVGVAAAAAAGALVAARGGGSKSSSQAGGIGAGTPTVGAPH